MGRSHNKLQISDLPPTKYTDLGEQLMFRLGIEILHNIGLIGDTEYFTKFIDNAEILDRDYRIWEELQKIEEY